MNVKQCKDCGRLFQFSGKYYCTECLDKQDEMFMKVREYIYHHPEAVMEEVSEKTEVPLKYIVGFLREERLELKTELGGLLCELCKKPISSGRFCSNCTKHLASAIDQRVRLDEKAAEAKRQNESSSKWESYVKDRI